MSYSVVTEQDIAEWVNFATEERKLKKDKESMDMASAGVIALLEEEKFMDELMDYQFNKSENSNGTDRNFLSLTSKFSTSKP